LLAKCGLEVRCVVVFQSLGFPSWQFEFSKIWKVGIRFRTVRQLRKGPVCLLNPSRKVISGLFSSSQCFFFSKPKSPVHRLATFSKGEGLILETVLIGQGPASLLPHRLPRKLDSPCWRE
jgi:hypothetical protein